MSSDEPERDRHAIQGIFFGYNIDFQLLTSMNFDLFGWLQNVVKAEKCVVNLENATDPTAPSKVFTYDAAYDFTTSTEVIYNDICYSLVEVRALLF